MSTDSALWFERLEARGPRRALKLFWIPHAGGSGYPYRTWVTHLPDWVELIGIRLPGRGPRVLETAFHRMDPLVTALSQAVTAQIDGPFAIFGHSMGALIAFELCTRLAQRGLNATHLFASATRAPHISRGDKQLHMLPRDAFLEELRKLNGTDAEILEDESIIAAFLPLLRADFELVETYPAVQRDPVHCPITVLGGERDTTVSEQELQEWSQYTTQTFRRVMFPGDHFFLLSDSRSVLRLVGETILSQLDGEAEQSRVDERDQKASE